MASPFAPPATPCGRHSVVAVDVTSLAATVRFDVATRRADVSATVDFVVDGAPGRPALDLRQVIESIELDGRGLASDAMAPLDMGAGDDAATRVLDVDLEAGSRHRLVISYSLATPLSTGAVPLGWSDDGLRFDLWMSDLFAGRYLEMWFPAPLCHDRFALSIDVALLGTDRPHLLVSNSATPLTPALQWQVRYPASFTALSPMLVIAPADQLEWSVAPVGLAGRAQPLELRCLRHVEVDADLAAAEADVVAWLAYMQSRYGPWSHGETMTALIWEAGRGMEYDGATTAAIGALEHEVFHSWFGRGIKPARAADGWIDEAWTTWATASKSSRGGRFGAELLGLDEVPVLLYPPHPWSRHTPMASYVEGSRLFATMAVLLGGADRLRSAMAGFYGANRGGLITTEALRRHLQSHSEIDLSPWWERYVHGRS